MKQVALLPLRKGRAVFLWSGWPVSCRWGWQGGGDEPSSSSLVSHIASALWWSLLSFPVFWTRYFQVTLPVSTDVSSEGAALRLTDRRVALSPRSSSWALPFDLKKYIYPDVFEFGALCGSVNAAQADIFVPQQQQFVELESEGGGVRSRLRDSLCPDRFEAYRSQLIRWDRWIRGAWRSLSAAFRCLWNLRGLNRAGGKPNSCVTSDYFKQTLIKVLAGSSRWLMKRQSIDRSVMGSRVAVLFKTRWKRLAELRDEHRAVNASSLIKLSFVCKTIRSIINYPGPHRWSTNQASHSLTCSVSAAKAQPDKSSKSGRNLNGVWFCFLKHTQDSAVLSLSMSGENWQNCEWSLALLRVQTRDLVVFEQMCIIIYSIIY